MKSKKPMTLKKIKLGLTSLIKDCVEMKANPILIKNYKGQLKLVEKAIEEHKQEQRDFRERIKKLKDYLLEVGG